MTLNDLPEIQITRNVRSTRLRLRVEGDQIRLTAPVFCSKKQIQNFIDQAESWLLKTWKLQQEKNQSIDRSLPAELQLFNQTHPFRLFIKVRSRTSFLMLNYYSYRSVTVILKPI